MMYILTEEEMKALTPVEAYRKAILGQTRYYRELLALGQAVNEHQDQQVIRERQQAILAADEEYQRVVEKRL
jgi:hypothetical protein